MRLIALGLILLMTSACSVGTIKGKDVIRLAKVAPAPIETKIAGKAQHISVDEEANKEKKLAVLSCM